MEEKTVDVKCGGCDRLLVIPAPWFHEVHKDNPFPTAFVCNQCFNKGEQWIQERIQAKTQSQ